jgi:hypothetical protein
MLMHQLKHFRRSIDFVDVLGLTVQQRLGNSLYLLFERLVLAQLQRYLVLCVLENVSERFNVADSQNVDFLQVLLLLLCGLTVFADDKVLGKGHRNALVVPVDRFSDVNQHVRRFI